MTMYQSIKRKSGQENDAGWWGDSDSSSDSSFRSSESKRSAENPEWAEYVDGQGDLFYVIGMSKGGSSYSQRGNFPFAQTSLPPERRKDLSVGAEKSSSGILVRLIRRKSSRRSFRKNDDDIPSFSRSKFGDWYEAKVRVSTSTSNSGYECSSGGSTISMVTGTDCSIVQTKLGLSLLVDRTRLVVTVPPLNHPLISTGDILCSIDGQNVNSENLEACLSNIPPGREVVLRLKSSKLKGSQKVSLLRASKRSLCGDDVGGWLVYAKSVGGSGNDESESEHCIEYCYPASAKASTNVSSPLSTGSQRLDGESETRSSPLVSAAGAFYTLVHLLPSFASNPPLSSTVILEDGSLVHVIYTLEDKDILLVGFPDDKVTLKEAILLNQSLVKCLKFTHLSLSRCFSADSNKSRLDRLIHSFFKSIRDRPVEIPSADNGLSDSVPLYQFECLLPAVEFLPIPKEIQVQLSDAMNELEANDIKEFESHRLYTVIGSIYFHKGYVVRWNIPKDDLVEVGRYFHVSGLIRACSDGLCDAALWTRVYPSSASRPSAAAPLARPPQGIQPYTLPANSSWFLAAVAQDYDMLAVLLESGGCTGRIEGNPGPNTVYMDEIQATLDHIQSLGIPKFISKWLDAQTGSSAESQGSSFAADTEPLNSSAQAISSSKSSPNVSVRVTSCTPPARHRNSVDYSSPVSKGEGDPDVTGGMMRSRSLSVGSVASSSGPILGRRAEREKLENSNQSRASPASDLSEDSDFRDFRSSDSGSLFDMTDFGRTLPHEWSIIPLPRYFESSGILHFIQVEGGEGVLISSGLSRYDNLSNLRVINTFRKYCHHIRTVLYNAVTFKKLKQSEIATTVLNKSLIAIKEHGIMFQSWPDFNCKTNSINYWAVGRIFFMPQLREVYVCYEDNCPLNMVEVAFRIGLNAYL